MKVAIFGGTGFVGSWLVDALLAAGHEPSLLIRAPLEHDRCRLIRGDIDDPDAINGTLEHCDALIYNIGLLREYTRRGITFEHAHFEGVRAVAAAAQAQGVRRFLLMSANGVKPRGTAYQETKYRAEQLVQSQGFDFTIFRPSVIFGAPRGRMEIATQLYRDLVRPQLPAPAFHAGLRPATGQLMMSPAWIGDVADAFVAALEDPQTIGRTIKLGGPEALSWTEMIRRVATATGRSKILLPVPVAAMRLAATLFEWLPFFPVTRDQLTMLAEGNTASAGELERLIGRKAKAFNADNLGYLSAGH
jgi:uncharacterized protein YbjT (DUF2867 family)